MGNEYDQSTMVEHTCNVTYGSYYEEGVKIVCDKDDDLDTVKSKIRKKLSLNFLSMATYSVKIINTNRL
jgi:hypothetical protein